MIINIIINIIIHIHININIIISILIILIVSGDGHPPSLNLMVPGFALRSGGTRPPALPFTQTFPRRAMVDVCAMFCCFRKGRPELPVECRAAVHRAPSRWWPSAHQPHGDLPLDEENDDLLFDLATPRQLSVQEDDQNNLGHAEEKADTNEPRFEVVVAPTAPNQGRAEEKADTNEQFFDAVGAPIALASEHPQEVCAEDLPNPLASTRPLMLVRSDILGRWFDGAGARYMVTEGSTNGKCSVKIFRGGRPARFLEDAIKIWRHVGLWDISWGKDFHLDITDMTWTAKRGSRTKFVWYRPHALCVEDPTDADDTDRSGDPLDPVAQVRQYIAGSAAQLLRWQEFLRAHGERPKIPVHRVNNDLIATFLGSIDFAKASPSPTSLRTASVTSNTSPTSMRTASVTPNTSPTSTRTASTNSFTSQRSSRRTWTPVEDPGGPG